MSLKTVRCGALGVLVWLLLGAVAWGQFTPAVHAPVPYPTTLNVKAAPYNCVGNGIADDTVCLQASLDTLGLTPNKSGSIYLPKGDYKITQTLTYTGAPGLGIHWFGEVGNTRGPSGSRIIWAGAAGGKMFYALGMNNSVIEQLEFMGGTLALVGLHIDATNADLGSGAGSSGVILRYVTVGALTGATANGVLVAHTPISGTNQISEVYLYDCTIVGDGIQTTSAGVKFGSTGNAKNYWISGGRYTGWGTGVDWSNANGVMTIKDIFFSSTPGGTDIKTGAGQLTIMGVESESSNMRFVTGTTGSNPGSLTIIGSSWESGAPSDDIIISYTGAVTLIGNQFRNFRTAGAFPRIVINNALMSGAGTASLTSIGNFYHNVVSTIPLYDGSGNPFFVIGSSFNTDKDAAITSVGDMGGTNGAMTHLNNYLPADSTRPLVETFANLGTVAPNFTLRGCSDCVHGSNPCTGGGTGAIAKRLAGSWVC